jgi:VanZ family protein
MNARKRSIAGGIALLVYAGIFLLSSLPAGSLPSSIPDIIPHGAEFFVLAFFFIQVFSRPSHLPTLVPAFFLLAVLGLLDEVHQLSVPGRVFSLLDLLYDLLGALAGMAAFHLLGRWWEKNKSKRIGRRLGILLLHR